MDAACIKLDGNHPQLLISNHARLPQTCSLTLYIFLFLHISLKLLSPALLNQLFLPQTFLSYINKQQCPSNPFISIHLTVSFFPETPFVTLLSPYPHARPSLYSKLTTHHDTSITCYRVFYTDLHGLFIYLHRRLYMYSILKRFLCFIYAIIFISPFFKNCTAFCTWLFLYVNFKKPCIWLSAVKRNPLSDYKTEYIKTPQYRTATWC